MAKLLISAGIALILLGVFLSVLSKAPFFGKLPGDILIQRKNFTFYFPFTTSVIVSILLSLIFWFFSKR